MRVALDPGHGGRDPGAIGRTPWTMHEADVVWSVTCILAALLERSGYRSFFTRRQSEYVGLTERARAANDWQADAFVSVHANGFEDRAVRGVEVLHYGSDAGRALASTVDDALRFTLTRAGYNGPFRGLKEHRRLTVLRRTRMPAALVELPFITNEQDHRWLSRFSFQNECAAGIATGLRRWRNS